MNRHGTCIVFVQLHSSRKQMTPVMLEIYMVSSFARLLYSRVANSWRHPCWPRDIYKFPFKCTDPCNLATYFEWMGSEESWRLRRYWNQRSGSCSVKEKRKWSLGNHFVAEIISKKIKVMYWFVNFTHKWILQHGIEIRSWYMSHVLVGLDTVDFKSSRLLKAAMFDEELM